MDDNFPGFQRVTDAQFAYELFSAGLLYEKNEYGPLEVSIGWDNSNPDWWVPRMSYGDWRFYLRLEE